MPYVRISLMKPKAGREAEAAADQAARSHRSMSLRSQLHIAVHRGHQERSFLAE